MAKTPEKTKMPADMSLLKADRIAELKEKARAAVTAERLKAAEDTFLEQETAAQRRAHTPSERLETLHLNFAPHIEKVTIDGDKAYWHNQTVTVPRSVADVLRETMYRSWMHQDHIEGKKKADAYWRQHESLISAVSGVIRA